VLAAAPAQASSATLSALSSQGSGVFRECPHLS